VLDELGGLSRRTFDRWRELGHAPTCIKLPNGEIRVGQAAPLRPLPDPISDQALITRLDIRRNDRLNGVLREYQHVA
jgi:hypothetical protein